MSETPNRIDPDAQTEAETYGRKIVQELLVDAQIIAYAKGKQQVTGDDVRQAYQELRTRWQASLWRIGAFALGNLLLGALVPILIDPPDTGITPEYLIMAVVGGLLFAWGLPSNT